VIFGSTSSRLGAYQIVATLQYLAHWTHTVYRPWFMRNALGVSDRSHAMGEARGKEVRTV
jgi:hypothetical protein